MIILNLNLLIHTLKSIATKIASVVNSKRLWKNFDNNQCFIMINKLSLYETEFGLFQFEGSCRQDNIEN